ncbi:MAG: hypothetical protein V4691_05300 [Pseudomonadota bacterium]
MDTSLAGRVVPVSDAFASRAVGKAEDSEIAKKETVTQVKDSSPSEDRRPHSQPDTLANRQSKYDRNITTDEDKKLVYRVVDPATKDLILELPLTLGTEGERAYEHQQIAENQRKGHDDSHQEVIA